MDISSYEEAIHSLYRLQKFGIKFGLSKTTDLLERLGKPHRGKQYVHIAGTNGKGSVAAFIASILRESGLRVGLYSSPHLVRFTERFKINDQEMPREKAVDLIQELMGLFNPDQPPTFFEATTALAITYFARAKTDIDIMEVGMGGRLDATNVILPLVSVITNISMEHQYYLGSRLLDIAREKAGIIKPGVDLVTGVRQPSVVRLFESMAKEKRAPIWRVGKDTRYRMTDTGLQYYGRTCRLKNLKPGLTGTFQARNAALALTVTEMLGTKGLKVSLQNFQKGIENSVWPGRMHLVYEDPRILLDGAHNPAAIRALVRAVRTGYKYLRLITVIGIMEDKDIDGLLQGIVPVSDYVIFTRPLYSRAADPNILAAKADRFKKPGKVIQPLAAALTTAKDMAQPQDLVLVTGSLFTVGEALTHFDSKTYQPDL